MLMTDSPCGISAARSETRPTSIIEDARMTFTVAHELCYAIDNILDEAMGATPENKAKAVPTGSGAFGQFAIASEEIRDRMQQTIYRLQSFRSQLGANQ